MSLLDILVRTVDGIGYDHVYAAYLWTAIVIGCVSWITTAVLWQVRWSCWVAVCFGFLLIAPVAVALVKCYILSTTARAHVMLWLPDDARVIKAVDDYWGDETAIVVFRLPAKSREKEIEEIRDKTHGWDVSIYYDPVTDTVTYQRYHIG
jgi:hypothetical protein